MFEQMPMEQSIISPRPDSNTAEAITYGDEYTFIKSATWWWDSLEDELNRQLEREMSRFIDPEFCLYVLRSRPNMIWARQPPVNEPDKMRDLRQLREVIKRGTALRDLKVRRMNNELYARLKGVEKHIGELRERGISDTMWMASTAGRNERIDFEMLREILDDDELKAEMEAGQIEKDLREYNREKEQFAREYAEYLRRQDEEFDPERIMGREESQVQEERPFDISDLPIFMDAPERVRSEDPVDDGDDPGSEEYWRSLPDDEAVGEDDDDTQYGCGCDEVGTSPAVLVLSPVRANICAFLDGRFADDVDWLLSTTGVTA